MNKKKEPLYIDLFSEELERKFKTDGKIYRRKIYPIRNVEKISESTTVETYLPDRTLESTRDAKTGDWIITGSKGEHYVLTDKKIHDLYIIDDKGGWIPKERRIVAIQNPFEKSVRILVPWGTAENPAYQDGNEKAMLVAELTHDGTMTSDRYIIGDYELLLNNYEPIN